MAPFSVLVDGNQVRVLDRLRAAAGQTHDARFPDNVLYIYRKQLEEADLVVLNKADLLSAAELADLKRELAEKLPDTPILTMSAATGDGVDAWLDHISQPRPVGRRIAAVDYDTYAAGEAALGWMNAQAKLTAREPVDWAAFAGELLEAIRARLRAPAAEIAHLKIYLSAGARRVAGNLTASDGPVSVRGHIDPERRETSLLLNARVHAQPDRLRAAVEEALQAAAGDRLDVSFTSLRSFFPGRPEPTHRYGSVV